jgi:hypothetical protein
LEAYFNWFRSLIKQQQCPAELPERYYGIRSNRINGRSSSIIRLAYGFSVKKTEG